MTFYTLMPENLLILEANILNMFNKSDHEVAIECAILNGKLRPHKGGRLNDPKNSRPVVLAVHPEAVTQPDYLKLIIGVLIVIFSLILIRKLF